MSDAVIVGLISASSSIIVNILLFINKSRETNATVIAHEQKQQDTLYEIKREQEEIKKRLDQHNGYAEKFSNDSRDIAVIQKDVENVKEQIKNLKVYRVK